MSRSRKSPSIPLSLFSFQDIITSVTGIMVLLTLLMALELIERVVASPAQHTFVQIEASGQSVAEMKSEIDQLHRQLESSNLVAADLPSFDVTTLQQERRNFENSSLRLKRELLELNDRASYTQRQLSQVEQQSVTHRDSEIQELDRLQEKNAEMRATLQSISSSNRIFFNKDQEGKETWLVEIAGDQLVAAEIGVSAKPRQFSSEQQFYSWLDSLNPQSTAFYLIVKPAGTEQFESYRKGIRSRRFDLGFHVMPDDQQVIDPKTGAGIP